MLLATGLSSSCATEMCSPIQNWCENGWELGTCICPKAVLANHHPFTERNSTLTRSICSQGNPHVASGDSPTNQPMGTIYTQDLDSANQTDVYTLRGTDGVRFCHESEFRIHTVKDAFVGVGVMLDKLA